LCTDLNVLKFGTAQKVVSTAVLLSNGLNSETL